jgi:hypothetical protein
VSGTDEFEPLAVLGTGPFAGHRLDVTRFRSVRLLTAEEAAPFEPRPGERLAANFLDAGRWYIARIPADAISDVIVHIQHVPHSFPGAHAQIRFRLAPDRGVTVVTQVAAEEPETTDFHDLIYTIEGNFAPGTSSTPAGGVEQSGVAYMLMSLRQKVSIMAVDGKLPVVRQYRLEVGWAEMQALFQRALDVATRASSDKMFNLIRRNCTTEAIRIIDGTLRYPTWRRLLAKVTYSGLPEAMHLYLTERGLLGPGSRLPDLADDPTSA